PPAMASLTEKIQCEARIRDLLYSEGLPPPDAVEYGYGSIRLFFSEPKVMLVIDIDDYTEVDEARQKRAESQETDETCPPDDQDRGSPFLSFPHPTRAQRN